MMRPQASILFAVLSMILLSAAAAPGQTLLPFIVDAAGDAQEIQPTTKLAKEPGSEGRSAEPPSTDNHNENQGSEGKSEEEPPADAEEASPEGQDAAEPEKPAKPPLSPEMAAFRNQVRRTLSQVYSRSLNAQNSLPAEVMAFCEAFGHTAEVVSGGRSSQKINAVGAVCWNYPCGGYRLLRTDGKQFLARVGFGHQQRPGQLLAMLALSRVPATYEIRIDDHHGTVADLVASEKLACQQGVDLSGTLIGLAFYANQESTWKSDIGAEWSVERVLAEELDRKADASRVDVIHRLMGISYALKQLDKEKVSTQGLIERAEKHLEEFHDFALELQNEDGTWNPGFLAYRGTSKDTDGTLFSTGSILAWLVYSLPEEQLEDGRVVRGLAYLNKQLAYQTSRRSASSSASRDVIGTMSAARALSLYDVRYFTPRTPPAPATDDETNKTAATASKTTGSSIASRPTAGRTRSSGS